MAFMDAIKNELNNEKQLTENGAVGYRTTGKKLLDLNFSVASLRGASEQTIINKFMDAYWEDPIVAMKWLFYTRDCREGLGERRLFRIVIKHLAQEKPEVIRAVFNFTSEYGRYDDLWCLLDTDLKRDVISLISEQIATDKYNMANNQSISLIFKWLPSENASSKETKRYATMIRKGLDMTSKNYRKMLSQMRKYINVVECKMSAKQWNEINYETVPSRANLIYNNAFLRNDEERRRAYLGALEKGEVKINAGTLFPHDIVHKYTNGGWSYCLNKYDAALEGMWKALPNTVKGNGNTLVVADGSGSMTCNVGGKTSVTALDVANALAIYFAERASGEFKDKYITFSENPKFVDFSKTKTLRDKIGIALSHNEVANTNIEAVFDLILNTAVKNQMSQEDIPTNILIISDMEFDACATTNTTRKSSGWYSYRNAPTATLFDTIAQKYATYGYKLPRLVFWNVSSRTSTIPVKENDLGVALVSGFSVNIINMVMSNKLSPYECLLDILNTERYQVIENTIKNVV